MWLYRLTHKHLSPIWSAYWRFALAGDVVGQPAEGPLILAMNHVSFLDPWFLGIAYPRPVKYLITEKWYYRSRFWRWFFRSYATIPVRLNDPEATIRVLGDELETGQVVGIFPEGKISRDGRIQRFRPGLARLAASSGAPVVPVGIVGSYESLPVGRRWPRRGPVTLNLGTPRVFPGAPFVGRSPPAGERRAFSDRIFREVCDLTGQPVREELLADRRRAAG